MLTVLEGTTKARCLHFAVAALALASCGQVPPPPQNKPTTPAAEEPPLAERLITFDQAAQIELPPESGFLRLARLRPVRAEQLSAVRFRLTDLAEGNPRETLMRIRPTRHPLEYFSHETLSKAEKGIMEAGLSLFGLTSVAYSVDVANDVPRVLNDIALTEGRLFSSDTSFKFTQLSGGTPQYSVSCKVAERRDARTHHPALSGQAAAFDCEAMEAGHDTFKFRVLYLDAYARYLPLTNFDPDPQFSVKFQITDVVVGQSELGK